MKKKVTPSAITFIAAFFAGCACYAVGFLLAGVLAEIAMSLVIALPPAIVVDDIPLVASALAANCLGIYVFSVIHTAPVGRLVFSIWLIVVAVVYAVFCFLYNDMHLLLYPVFSIALNVYNVVLCAKEKGAGENA